MKKILNQADEMSRRRFMSNTAKALLGVGMFQASASRALGMNIPFARPDVAENVIYLFMNGGMSHVDTFDMGDKNNNGIGSIPSNVDGSPVSEYMPKMAKLMDKVAVINSMSSTQGDHGLGQYMMHTSYEKRASVRHPYLGTWMSKMSGKHNPDLPSNVVIGGGHQASGGFFEAEHAPVFVPNPYLGLQDVATSLSDKEFNDRLRLAQELDRGFCESYKHKNVHAYTEMYDDAIRVMKSADLKAFDLKQEHPVVRQEYGMNSFGQGCLLARRLVEHKVRFVEVALGGWDTHIDNFAGQTRLSSTLDTAMGALINDLHRRGMLQKTLVVLATEFGRTPGINTNKGRDHFPAAFTCLLAGGGVKQGIRYGKTHAGAKVIDKKMSIQSFNATIAHAVGLPYEQIMFSPAMRPFRVADKGKPALDLFAS